MAKPNYSFEKRQRELAKKKKKEEKEKEKAGRKAAGEPGEAAPTPEDGPGSGRPAGDGPERRLSLSRRRPAAGPSAGRRDSRSAPGRSHRADRPPAAAALR